MRLQEDIAECNVGKIVLNANEATETATDTITVYMSEDAHEQMLLPQESESQEESNSETADSVVCVKDENSYYAGLPVASVTKTSNIYCQYWCTNGGNHRGKYFRYSRVDQMCWCLNTVVSQNRDSYYTSGETICGSGTNFPTTPDIMNVKIAIKNVRERKGLVVGVAPKDCAARKDTPKMGVNRTWVELMIQSASPPHPQTLKLPTTWVA